MSFLAQTETADKSGRVNVETKQCSLSETKTHLVNSKTNCNKTFENLKSTLKLFIHE